MAGFGSVTNRLMPEAESVLPARDTVMVWAAQLDLGQEQSDDLAGLLSADEHDRAARFQFDEHRRRYIAARGILRLILGRCLNLRPEQVCLVYGAAGKPALHPDEGVYFNLAHSHQMALYAVTYQRQVGVDLEFIRPVADMAQIAASNFSACEYADWQGLPAAEQQAGFFNCWTRKEAYIKARGEGLLYPLDRFDVSLRPGQPAQLLRVEGSASEAARWSLQAVNPHPGYAAALAIEGRGWSLAWRGWYGTFA